MNDTKLEKASKEEGRIFYAGFADHQQASDRNMSREWRPYEATPEGYEQAIIDGYTAKSIFEFSHEVPDEKNTPQPLRYGNFTLDIDAKKELRDENGDVIKTVGDIEQSLKAVIAFTDYMYSKYELEPEDLLYFASGGKGFHVEIPSVIFGAEHGDIELPSIYQSLYDEILRLHHDKIEFLKGGVYEVLNKSKQYATFDFDPYVDKCGFKGGKGQLLRLAHIKRADGKYKVPITYDEIINHEAPYFEELVLYDRKLENEPLLDDKRANLQAIPKLEELFLHYKNERSSRQINANTSDALNMVTEECEFINFFHGKPYDVDEPRWFYLARVLTFAGGFGMCLFHTLSRFDKQRYNRRECNEKLRHAFKYGVATCKEIRKRGYCQKDCGVKCPIDIYQKKHADSYDKGSYDPTAEGLYYYPDSNDLTNKVVLSSYIKVKALSRDENSISWSKFIEVQDPDNIIHHCIISNTDLSGSGELALAILSDNGLWYDTNQKTKLLKYLRTTQPSFRTLLVYKNGWIGNTLKFFPFDEGEQDDGNFIYSHIPITKRPFEQVETLEKWQKHIAELCIGNPLLQIAIMTALSGPFLKSLGHQGFGIHFYGNSSSGKTTCLKIANSVSGGQVKTWRATDNALEGTAEQYNDNCLLLDEIGQCTPDVVDHVTYMLSNGQGKARGSKDGGARRVLTWNLVFLSSGELPIADKIKQGYNKICMPGQEVRCISILADGGTKQGVFTHISGDMSPADFADTLTKHSEKYQGLAILQVIKLIKMSDKECIVHEISSEAKKFLSTMKEKLSPQAERVARHFAFLASVGEYCIKHNLLPWKHRDAHLAADFCFKQWLQHNGNTDSFEIIKIAENILNLVAHDFHNKFNYYGEHDEESKPVFRYEESRKECWFMARGFLINEGICKSYQYKGLVEYLSKKNLLILDHNGNVKTQKWAGSNKNRPRGFSIIKDNIYLDDISKDDVITVDSPIEVKEEHVNINIEDDILF